MTSKKKTLALFILDGWGYREETENNAVAAANTIFKISERSKVEPSERLTMSNL